MEKGVIYDLDGTIVDSSKLHEKGWLEAGKIHHVPISDQFLKDQSGISNDEAAMLALGERFTESGGSFIQTKHSFVMQNAGSVILYPDFLEAYQKLLESGLKAWICTSAYKPFVEAIFESVPELKVFQDRTIWREMYQRGKPNPDSLLTTSERMGLNIKECLYVGDAFNDYLTAQNAEVSRFVYFCRNLKTRDSKIPQSVPTISKHTQLLSIVS